MATSQRERAVWVAVYVERPRRRRLTNNHHHYHHLHHHHHLHVHRPKQQHHAGNGRGYNRRAELLEYSRQLRESARSQASSPFLHPNPASHANQHPMTQMIPIRRNNSIARKTPTCLSTWKFLIPSFLRSLIMSPKKKEKKKRTRKNTQSAATRIKTVMKNFQVHKNKGFMSKMFASLRKHR